MRVNQGLDKRVKEINKMFDELSIVGLFEELSIIAIMTYNIELEMISGIDSSGKLKITIYDKDTYKTYISIHKEVSGETCGNTVYSIFHRTNNCNFLIEKVNDFKSVLLYIRENIELFDGALRTWI